MAVYDNLQISTLLNGEDDNRKLRSYLFQNNELLRYMFNNLDPEDNYSDDALQKYIERDRKIVTLELTAEGFRTDLKNLQTETETSFKIMDGLIQAEITRATDTEESLSSRITINEKAITLKVAKGEVSSQLSLESGQVKITGNRLVVESTNFQLDSDGNAKFSGTITGSTISGSSFKSDIFNVNNDGIELGDFEVSADATYNFRSKNGEVEIYASNGPGGTKVAGLVVGRASIYGGHFYGDGMTVDYVDADSSSKNYSYFYDIYLGKSWWDGWNLTETVQDLWEQVDDLSDERAKENIEDIDADEATSFLLGARPVTFQYKRDGKISAGFIAQEVDATMDELEIYFPIVGTDARTGLYKVDYKVYIPLLVKAYQKLYAEIEEIKNEKGNQI